MDSLALRDRARNADGVLVRHDDGDGGRGLGGLLVASEILLPRLEDGHLRPLDLVRQHDELAGLGADADVSREITGGHLCSALRFGFLFV